MDKATVQSQIGRFDAKRPNMVRCVLWWVLMWRSRRCIVVVIEPGDTAGWLAGLFVAGARRCDEPRSERDRNVPRERAVHALTSMR